MFQGIRLRQLISFGFSLPIVLLLVLTGAIWSTSTTVFNSVNRINKAEEAMLKTDEMTIALLLMVRDFRGYLLFEKEDLVKIVEENWQVFQNAAKAASEAVEDPVQKERLNKMIELGRSWKIEFADEVIQLAREGKREQGLAITIAGKGITKVDEFDRLNKQFNAVARESLKQAQIETKNSLQSLWIMAAGGTFLAIGIGTIGSSFISSRVTQRINQETEVIAEAAREIAVTVEQQERATTQQASAVNQTTTTMNELNVSLQQSSQQAEATATGSRDALVLTEGGIKAVECTQKGMINLKGKVDIIANQIFHLNEQTNQIGNISQLVSQLANQTNMLALNAAVEAVRAGEHGKGFAVVATEIRKLAEESKKSATKINTLVSDIQTANNMTVLATDEGMNTVEEGVQVSQTTATAFDKISSSINTIVMNNQQIYLNIKQQAIAMEQVIDAMNSINIASKETSEGILQVRIGIQKLNDAAQNLRAIV